jgi:hypothetical protein
MGDSKEARMDEKYGFLEEEAPDEVVPEQAAEPEVAQVVTPETPAPVTPTVTDPPIEGTHVPLAALKAEREKRQRMEQELARISQQIAQQQAPQIPGFYEAPEQHVNLAVTQAQQAVTARMYAAFEEDAREAYADYDEVLAELAEAANENPALRAQVFNAPNPAKAAYKLGKQLRALKSAPDPAALRKEIEAEVRAQIKAEAEAAEKARAAQVAAIPPDLSAARSARDQEVVEDDSLDSILASRRKR